MVCQYFAAVNSRSPSPSREISVQAGACTASQHSRKHWSRVEVVQTGEDATPSTGIQAAANGKEERCTVLPECPHRWVLQEQEAAHGKSWRQQTVGTNLPLGQPGVIAGNKNTHLLSRGEDRINIYDRGSKRKTTGNEELGLEKVCYEFVVETLTQILPDH